MKYFGLVIFLMSLLSLNPAYADSSTTDFQKKFEDKAIAELNQSNTEEQRFCALGRAAKAYFNQGNNIRAKQLADELKGLIPKYPKHWNYGNAIQDANIVLGRIAVADGHTEDAKNYLLDAANSLGSPQMNSFGPNMSLAKDLLEKGQKDIVLQYFEHCGKFWKMDFGKLKEWAEEVKNGKIPDFGANLVY